MRREENCASNPVIPDDLRDLRTIRNVGLSEGTEPDRPGISSNQIIQNDGNHAVPAQHLRGMTTNESGAARHQNSRLFKPH